MTEEMDTPQVANDNPNTNEAFEGPWPTQEESSNQNTVEDAFFGSQETPAEEAPQQGTPEPAPPVQEQPYEAKNDEKRFEYWQSQAAQKENQLAQMQQQVDAIQQNMQQPVAQPEPMEESFPEPPEKPGRPRGFSREEAMSDPSSDSARYLDDLEDWRDNTNDYNAAKQEYNLAQIQEKYDAQERIRHEDIQRQQAAQAQVQQMHEVKGHLTGHYAMQSDEADQFIQVMSDPSSLSLDNLVQLYRMQNSQPQTENAGPSQAFRQAQRAQQIPSPMGVQTGQGGGNDARSAEDSIMDNMISDFKSKNPW